MNIKLREKLLTLMNISSNLKDLPKDESNIVLLNKIKQIVNFLCDIQVEQNLKTDYIDFSENQYNSSSLAYKNITNSDFINAYYEICNFVIDDGNMHDNNIFTLEKRELLGLLGYLYKSIEEEVIADIDITVPTTSMPLYLRYISYDMRALSRGIGPNIKDHDFEINKGNICAIFDNNTFEFRIIDVQDDYIIIRPTIFVDVIDKDGKVLIHNVNEIKVEKNKITRLVPASKTKDIVENYVFRFKKL